ncbi:DUF4433 domain-containing protein [Nocardioides sp. KR10-350]|uniref:DUF4433 domain-containing protein n=1 Tax=Nocardioides cheoyonin TaxID=3156615 RepID=UPI0032B36876
MTELHYMAPMANLASIASLGLMSHARASDVAHDSVALADVQDRRAGKRVPGGRLLHEYVNLYFDARNAMMWMRRSDDLVVVRIAPAVLDLDGVVVSDGNAANGPTRFFPSPGGLANLDAERVYAEWWTHDDYWEQQERKRQRQAEVLVPDVVSPEHILGCYTWRSSAAQECRRLAAHWAVEVNAHVYFA